MALALLLRRWGDPLAVVVDHGLRPGSGAEATLTVGRLAAMDIPARLVRLEGLFAGADLGARARKARYAALLAVCRTTGRPDLFVAHHRQDQAETWLLRAARGSGAAGLAGMAAVAWRGDARLLRPLLPIAPARLRATLMAAGIAWVDDPTNTDVSTLRGGMRARGVPDCAAEAAAAQGRGRAEAERGLAAELGRQVRYYPTGHAVVVGPLSVAGWSAVIGSVSGRDHPPAVGAVARLVHAGGGTLHGVLVRGGVVSREPAAMAGPILAEGGAVWDGRFSVRRAARARASAMLGGLGSAAAGLRRRGGLPSVVLRTLPCLKEQSAIGTDLLTVLHLAYAGAAACPSVQVEYRPPRLLAGAPFGLV